MNTLEEQLLTFFAKAPEEEFSTSQLVHHLFHKESVTISQKISSTDLSIQKIGKRQKARLHRKLLYHLNKLTNDQIILVSKIKHKGEKFFTLNPNKQILCAKDIQIKNILENVLEKRTSVVNSQFPLASYEEQNLLRRFDASHWDSTVNAILLETKTITDLQQLYERLERMYSLCNDVIGIVDFQRLLNITSLEQLILFTTKILKDAQNYNKRISISIDVSEIKKDIVFCDFISFFAAKQPKHINFTFFTTTITLKQKARVYKHIITEFSQHKIRLNIQNNSLKKAPLIPGKAGMYGLSETDYSHYQHHFQKHLACLCLAETSLYLDFHRLRQQGFSYSQLRTLMQQAAQALISGTAAKRRKSNTLFKKINQLNGSHSSTFFAYAHNYIRLWNYNLQGEKEEQQTFLAFLETCKKELEEFSNSEETIFKSCGIPIHPKITLSSAFKTFSRDTLSTRQYKKFTIKSQADINTPQLANYLSLRQQLNELFDSIERLRFFRASNFTTDEILKEFHTLLATGSIPFFSYDFRSRKGELTLQDFFT